jgi:hypothetical protein
MPLSMQCACGADLGRVTMKTPGLCSRCGRSLWMQRARATRPRSAVIASRLDMRGAVLCPHGNSVCRAKCGVERLSCGGWHPVALERRDAWFERFNPPRVPVTA